MRLQAYPWRVGRSHGDLWGHLSRMQQRDHYYHTLNCERLSNTVCICCTWLYCQAKWSVEGISYPSSWMKPWTTLQSTWDSRATVKSKGLFLTTLPFCRCHYKLIFPYRWFSEQKAWIMSTNTHWCQETQSQIHRASHVLYHNEAILNSCDTIW